VQDIVSRFFLTLLLNGPNCQEIDNLPGYFNQSIRNLTFNDKMLKKTRRRILAKLDWWVEEGEDTQLALENEALWMEKTEAVRAEISLLSDRTRNVLRRYFEGKSTKQIAAEMGLEIQSVSSHRARGIQLVRESLAKK
jgi:RNA polymerase sigma factor (sigma-70 family)